MSFLSFSGNKCQKIDRAIDQKIRYAQNYPVRSSRRIALLHAAIGLYIKARDENLPVSPMMWQKAVLALHLLMEDLVVKTGPVIGRYQGQDIPAWIVLYDGTMMFYDGLTTWAPREPSAAMSASWRGLSYRAITESAPCQA